MILQDIKQAHGYLPSLNLKDGNTRFADFFVRAQQWLVSHIIGDSMEATLEAEVGLTAKDSHAALRDLCRRIIAEKALLDAIPEMDMQLTEAGFAVQNNEEFSPASSQRVDRLTNTMPLRIMMDCDTLVKYLIGNSDGTQANPKPYDSWRSTEQYKYLTACFMPTTAMFNRHLMPGVRSYEEYYDSLSTTAMQMKTVAAYYVSGEEVDRLVELMRDNELLEVHREAIAWLCRVATSMWRGDERAARNFAMYARNIMLANLAAFPSFANSDAYNTPAVNLDGGKLVNFL